MSFLTANLWKIATGGAAIVAMVLGIMLTVSNIQNNDLTRQRNQLTASINDPKTGFIAQLSQARTNVAQLETTVETQNKAYETLSATSKAQLAAARAELAAAQSQTRVMERKLAGFLATAPQGDTLEQRVRDIDDRAMKEFLP